MGVVAQVPLFCTDLSSLPLAGASESRACNVKVRAGTRTPGTLRRGQAGGPRSPGCLTHVFSGPQRGAGEPGAGGVAETQPVAGRQLWRRGHRGGGAGGPSLGQLQVGTDIWRICCHGNGEIGKGRGAEDAKSEPYSPPHPTPGCRHHDNINRSQAGAGRVGSALGGWWGPGGARSDRGAERGASPQSTNCQAGNRVSQGGGGRSGTPRLTPAQVAAPCSVQDASVDFLSLPAPFWLSPLPLWPVSTCGILCSLCVCLSLSPSSCLCLCFCLCVSVSPPAALCSAFLSVMLRSSVSVLNVHLPVSPLIYSPLNSLGQGLCLAGVLPVGVPSLSDPLSPGVSLILASSLQLCGASPMPRIRDLRVSRRRQGSPDGRECPHTW